MTIPASGQISATNINAELTRPWNQQMSLNDPAVRQLAGKPGGQIAYSDLRGKTGGIIVYPEHRAKPGNDAQETIMCWGWERSGNYSFGNISTPVNRYGTMTSFTKYYFQDEYSDFGWRIEIVFNSPPGANVIWVRFASYPADFQLTVQPGALSHVYMAHVTQAEFLQILNAPSDTVVFS